MKALATEFFSILLETWALQAQAGVVTAEALETILARAAIPILRQFEEQRPELVVVVLLAPSPDASGVVRSIVCSRW